ncbi:MAG TPA: 2Fe-2S iron-sulfur cluster binding domain-containing protein [Alcanivoracaceae bacterium]|nr:2Fe-2S iron-sulfur cluster binding domain-containing protein [Alcanivoracaceae bacterium]
MFGFFKKNKNYTANINGTVVEVGGKQTLLPAGLAQGLPMAHSCRVGGCGSCKCRLVEGKVKALTDFSYVLSGEELSQQYILACQSVPQTNITVEAQLTQAVGTYKGRVVAQEMLTHDITHLQIRLDNTFQYKAGQYAELAVHSLPGVYRNFSFADKPSTDGQVSFFIRRVENGLLTEHIMRHQLVGERVTLRAPMGDFWLRPSEALLLMVAGGSGLAPIRAMLQNMQEQGVAREVVLLFGARRERDVYLQEELTELAATWPAAFTFIPVLSEAGDDQWQGARGLVTEHIQTVLTPFMHVYLCGPPPMVDAACEVLAQQGIAAEHIHADRFLVEVANVAS